MNDVVAVSLRDLKRFFDPNPLIGLDQCLKSGDVLLQFGDRLSIIRFRCLEPFDAGVDRVAFFASRLFQRFQRRCLPPSRIS